MARLVLAAPLLCAAAMLLSGVSSVPVRGASAAATNLQASGKTTMLMWDLADLFPSPDAWMAQYETVKADAQRLQRFKGSLSESAGDMLSW